jgi:fluoroacetyl-CoA thioesterase
MTTLRFLVTQSDTAIALGSGDVPVLATPRLLAWMEAATVQAAHQQLGPGQTSVGTHVELRHRRATPVGRAVLVHVVSVQRSGAHLQFEVTAVESAEQARPAGDPTTPGGSAVPGADPPAAAPDAGPPLATAKVTRAVVDRGQFLAALESR